MIDSSAIYWNTIPPPATSKSLLQRPGAFEKLSNPKMAPFETLVETMVARDIGTLFLRIENPDQMGSESVEAVASGKPCAINAIVRGREAVSAEPFRRDVFNMPVRHLSEYEHLNTKQKLDGETGFYRYP